MTSVQSPSYVRPIHWTPGAIATSAAASATGAAVVGGIPAYMLAKAMRGPVNEYGVRAVPLGLLGATVGLGFIGLATGAIMGRNYSQTHSIHAATNDAVNNWKAFGHANGSAARHAERVNSSPINDAITGGALALGPSMIAGALLGLALAKHGGNARAAYFTTVGVGVAAGMGYRLATHPTS
jgi:hypothetical protein